MRFARDPILREVFILFGAWGTLAEHLATRDDDPRTVDPHDIYGRACTADRDRLIALLYGHGHGESMLDAEDILGEVLALAVQGRRPRFGREVGLAPEEFVR